MNRPSLASVFQPISCQLNIYSASSSLRFCTEPPVWVVVTCAVETPLLRSDSRLVVIPADAPKPIKLEPAETDRLTETPSVAVLLCSEPTEAL